MNSVTEIQQNSKKSFAVPQFGLWHKKLLLAFIDLCILTYSLFYYHKFTTENLSFYHFFQGNSLSVLFGIGIFWILTIIFNFYDLDYVNKTRKVLPLSFFIGIIFTLTYFITTSISSSYIIEIKNLFFFTIIFTLLLMFWRVFYASVIHSNVFAKNCILLTSEETDRILIDRIIESIEGIEFEYGLKILRTYTVTKEQKQIDRLSRAIERMTRKKLMDTVIIMDRDQGAISNSLNTTLVKAIGNGIQVETYFKLYEDVKEAIPVQFAGNQLYTILPISKYSHNYIYLLWHKLVDILSSVLGLSTMLILTPIIVFMNLFLNKGPLFYRQFRVGKGGKEIEIIKFRSMIVKAEEHGAKMSIKGDQRVTSFGKILRKLRIDELPQFWSVLKGEMSLIGPRPERKIFIDQLVKSIPLYDSRHLIKPGITGWAQVKYEYGENTEDSIKKLEYDLYYIKNRSVTLDIRIIFKTINTILFYKGV
ncbi:sugar transferase [Lutimonas halocynthiae]|uniref:sugar transferase n=1 Tax=Lutimonas halocynthiae TaxID=1446477 RepID=UPI0025B37C21|nr:sugar transferase [Lutimonas halocynthiae]MDN3642102.1 sugar transferase [Lutimonas halocynthiae]